MRISDWSSDVCSSDLDPPILESVQADLRNPAARTKARDVARNVLSDVAPRLEATTWWTPSWLDDVLQAIPVAFAQATDRWRTLYRSARTQYEQQGVLAVSPNADRSEEHTSELQSLM